MLGKHGGKKVKLQVYLKSRDKPDDTLKLVAAYFGAMGGRNPDPVTKSMMNATRHAADIDNRRDPGLVDLHFNIMENSALISFKTAIEELGCDYEFIDVRTGTLLDYDLNTLNIFIVGKRKINRSEMNLPIPCLKVKDAVLQFKQDRGLDSDSIKTFYLNNAQ